MSDLDPIYVPWAGNAEAMATDLGLQGVTVRQWRNRGRIPPEYWPAIIEAAQGRGFTLHWRQFIVAEPKARVA